MCTPPEHGPEPLEHGMLPVRENWSPIGAYSESPPRHYLTHGEADEKMTHEKPGMAKPSSYWAPPVGMVEVTAVVVVSY